MNKVEIKGKTITAREGEYIKGNMIYCEKCNDPKITVIDGAPYQVNWCSCKDKAKKEEKIERFKQHLLNKYGRKYYNINFKNTDIDRGKQFEDAYIAAKMYADKYKDYKNAGIGLYLHGKYGSGKTHLAICIAKQLEWNGHRVMFKQFNDILEKIKTSFNNYSPLNADKDQIIYNLTHHYSGLLIIDDIGNERFKRGVDDTYSQEIVYKIVDERLKNNLPTIFTSNFKLSDLVESKGLWQKTADRINEMTYKKKYEMNGKSYRGKKAEEKLREIEQ